ncbi:PDC sensor domain-containing protein [Thermocrinis minervae]|uniref:CBS domain-containing protein n=1 Tax=Thermocrinis minervae TaxID=381751 RepID=A0A1M6SXU3_9AQUI|nr:CBS domain-containing protein [Thermocrinis minervae]SHK49513.1 CBS domain-containing protein [Thermocrinis minervae]
MKELWLSEIATGVPTVEGSMTLGDVQKVFEEYGIFDNLVVLRSGLPVGIIYRNEVRRATCCKKDLKVEDLVHTLPKLKDVRVAVDEIYKLMELFGPSAAPILVVNREGKYMGVLYPQVILHFLSMYKEASIPVFRRISTVLGKPYYLHVFFLEGIKAFQEAVGSSKAQLLLKAFQELVKDYLEGDLFLSSEEREIYLLSKEKALDSRIKELMQEFHKEFSLLYAGADPVYVHGYSVNLSKVPSMEDLYKLDAELKNRLSKVKDVSFFINHDLIPSVVVCEYRAREALPIIREKLKRDVNTIVAQLQKTDRELWEYVLYDFFKQFPYFELFYVINEKGIQISNNIVNPKIKYPIKTGKKGADRSQKDYFIAAVKEGFYITNVYISQATDDFCITVSEKFTYGGKTYVLACDINYREIHRLLKG